MELFRASLAGLIVLATAAACYSRVDEARSDSLPASGCTDDIESIRTKIFVPRCATSGCHTGKEPEGALDLGAAGVDGRLIGAAAAECGEQTLVTPGAPERSYLIDKLTSKKPACGDPMPNGATSLAASDIECIRAWIAKLPATATGDAGTRADAGPACGSGETACGAACVDTNSDPKNCGKCGTTCPVACASGACVATCPSPTTNCSGACVDTQKSAQHCGKCGNACPDGKVCSNGVCTCGASAPFASTIQPIFANNCVDSGCHTGAKPKASLDCTSAAKSFAGLVNVASTACSSRTRVVPGDVSKSYLVNKLTGVGMCAGTRMPKADQALAAADLDRVRSWICNGAKND